MIRIEGLETDEVVARAEEIGIALTPTTIELTDAEVAAEESHRAWLDGYEERTRAANPARAGGAS